MNIQILADLNYPDGSWDIRIYDSWIDGNTVLISTGLHWNEIWPMPARQDIINKIASSGLGRGKIIEIPQGNPGAVRLWIRDIEGRDLNRMFGDISQGTMSQALIGTAEQRRVDFIKWVIIRERVTHIFDLHSLSGQSRVPFLYVPNDMQKISLAANFWVNNLVVGWSNLTKILRARWISRPLQQWLADYWNNNGIAAFTFEAGSHDSPDAAWNTNTFLTHALTNLWLMMGGSRTAEIPSQPKKIFMTDVHLWRDPTKVVFEWKIDPVNFMKFNERTLVAVDAKQEIYLEAWQILVQPKAVGVMKPGEEAFFIWEIQS